MLLLPISRSAFYPTQTLSLSRALGRSLSITNQPTKNRLKILSVTATDLRICCLHVLELIHAALGVAFADFAQRLVLVTPLADVLAVDLVVGRLHRVIPREGQVLLEGLLGEGRIEGTHIGLQADQ